jgi:lysophospholipase L1-like esterase
MPVLLVVLLVGGVAAVGTRVVMVRSGRSAQSTAGPLLRGAQLAPAGTGTSTCTDPAGGRQWQVSWRVRSDGPSAAAVLEPTGFAVRALAGTPSPTSSPTPRSTPGPTSTSSASASPGWQTADQARWALQWNPTRAEMLTSTRGVPHELVGSLTVLAGAKLSATDSPRYITPDGACSVFLSPFTPATTATPDSVAVIGDSLVAQLYPPDDSSSSTGALVRRLAQHADRSEIIGVDGQRWAALPGQAPGLSTADLTMLDEMRGLRSASALVIALGRNDAGWVALATTPAQFERRMAWVTRHLAAVIDELRDGGQCTVLVTTATRDKKYSTASTGWFRIAGQRINAYLRARASAGPDDQLKVSDWAVLADQHTSIAAVPWFGASTVRLNEAGLTGYADELTAAAALC